WQQTTAADFNAGTQDNTVVTNITGGEVQLALNIADDFSGSVLGSSWTPHSWTGGDASLTVALSGGILTVARSEILSTQAVAGTPVEGLVSFSAPYQHFGLATDVGAVAGNYWAIFSTMGTNNTLFARVNANGFTTDVSLGALPTGFHTYRVQPIAGAFQ